MREVVLEASGLLRGSSAAEPTGQPMPAVAVVGAGSNYKDRFCSLLLDNASLYSACSSRSAMPRSAIRGSTENSCLASHVVLPCLRYSQARKDHV